MGANVLAGDGITSFRRDFAKQDKKLAQFAPTPVPTRSGAGNPHRTFEGDGELRIRSFSSQVAPTLFALLDDPVFREHARLKALLNKNEREIAKATGKEGLALVENLLSFSSWLARIYRGSDYYDDKLKPETFMDGVLFLAEMGVARMEGCYETPNRA